MTTIQRALPRSLTKATGGVISAWTGLLMAAAVCGGASTAGAAPYNFLSVSGNNQPGNAAMSTFTSNITNNSFITVRHIFSSPAAVGYADNNNALIFPSDFTPLFPGTGQVQGHLAMTVYGDPNSPIPGGNINTSQVIFSLGGYKGSLPDLVFGVWNTTDEVPLPAYNIQIRDSNSAVVSPSSFVTLGFSDNLSQVAGRHQMLLNTLTGDITAPTQINNGNGVHTSAIFFKGIPLGTQEIIVTANLPPLNTIGDGVGYYFAEQVPEPSTWVLSLVGVAAWGAVAARGRWRSCRQPLPAGQSTV